MPFGAKMAENRLKMDVLDANLLQNTPNKGENTAFFRFPGIPGKLDLIPGNFPIPGNSKNPGNTASLRRKDKQMSPALF